MIYKYVNKETFITQNNCSKFIPGRKKQIIIQFKNSHCYFNKNHLFPIKSFKEFCAIKGIELNIIKLKSQPPSYQYCVDLINVNLITEFLNNQFYEVIFQKNNDVNKLSKNSKCFIS